MEKSPGIHLDHTGIIGEAETTHLKQTRRSLFCQTPRENVGGDPKLQKETTCETKPSLDANTNVRERERECVTPRRWRTSPCGCARIAKDVFRAPSGLSSCHTTPSPWKMCGDVQERKGNTCYIIEWRCLRSEFPSGGWNSPACTSRCNLDTFRCLS